MDAINLITIAFFASALVLYALFVILGYRAPSSLRHSIRESVQIAAIVLPGLALLNVLKFGSDLERWQLTTGAAVIAGVLFKLLVDWLILRHRRKNANP